MLPLHCLSFTEDRCPPPRNVDHATANSTLAERDSIIQYTCSGTKVFPDNVQDVVIRCNGSDWSDVVENCIGNSRHTGFPF